MPLHDPPTSPEGDDLRPIRELGLRIEGSPLEPILAEFAGELARAGLRRVRPRFYLSTEWGVPDGTVAVAIPFYLARPDLAERHAKRTGFVEGRSPADILRYLRHETGHVVNYAYRLHERPEWIDVFGPMSRPYHEEYRPEPFSRRFVRHLPGWYAQKHPDEDWAETFAVWMTPGLDWRAEYRDWPVALAKLEFCARAMAEVADAEPLISADDLDEDVGEIAYSLDHFYRGLNGPDEPLPPGIDGALRAIFEDLGRPETADPTGPRQLASALIDRLRPALVPTVYRWTGHFPERTQALLDGLARRADALSQVYPEVADAEAAVGLTALVTALAMNHVHRGNYVL